MEGLKEKSSRNLTKVVRKGYNYNMENKGIAIKIDAGLYNIARNIAKSEDRSITSVIRKALQNYFRIKKIRKGD